MRSRNNCVFIDLFGISVNGKHTWLMKMSFSHFFLEVVLLICYKLGTCHCLFISSFFHVT